MSGRYVEHVPIWEPAQLPIDAEGNTRPGYVCIVPMENGNGPCGGNVFHVEDEVGNHGCIVSSKKETMLSATARQFTFAVVVEDVERWPAEAVAAADPSDDRSYDDWVVRQLVAAMYAAGEEFMAKNPGLFRPGVGLI